METIEIKLTEDQILQLGPLEDLVLEAFMKNKRGSIMAQVSPGYGSMHCVFCTHDEVLRMYTAMGKTPGGIKKK